MDNIQRHYIQFFHQVGEEPKCRTYVSYPFFIKNGLIDFDANELCLYHMDFESMQTWYDGYSFHRVQHVSKTCKATIPNLEVADAFADAVSGKGWAYVATAIQDSDSLLEATMNGDCEKLATALEKTYESVSSVLEYNNEASLSAAVILA